MSMRPLHTKANRIEIKKGPPSPNEGNNGELRLGVLSKGIFLYVKYGTRWYQLGDAAISSGGQFSAQGVASQGAGTLATSIDRSNQSLQMGGNIVMSEQTISHNGSNNGIKFDNGGDLYIQPETNITYFESNTSGAPKVVIKNTNSDTQGGQLRFLKDKGAAGADGDDIGTIVFIADDAGQTLTSFASIVAEISEADHTDEAGKLSFYVAESDGTTTALTAGLVLEGEHATDGQVDVNIGAGVASMTTIAGDLDIDGDTISSAANMTLDSGGSLILDTHNGRMVSNYNGNEFSPGYSSYAGMILGYTYIRNTDAIAGDDTIALTTSLDALQTVNGTDVKVRFTVPPSGNVEIDLTCMVYASSREFTFSLSTGGPGSYSALDASHEYDAVGIKPDETDYIVANPKWVVTGLTAGTDTTYYIAAKISSTPGSIYHGVTRTGLYTQPIIVRATALPLSGASQMNTGT